MKKILENTCLTGCLVYVAALVVIVTLGSSSLGGLGARFGLGSRSLTPTIVGGSGNVTLATGQATPPGLQGQQQSELPPPLVSAPTQTPPPEGTNASPTISVRGEGISGQATPPFYVVQSGDTLWGLANRFGTTVDALRSINKLGNRFIRPGQLLYLPPTAQEKEPGPH